MQTHHAAFFHYQRGAKILENRILRIALAKEYLNYKLRYPETGFYLEKYQCQGEGTIQDTILTVTEDIWRRHSSIVESGVPRGYAEFYALLGITSRELLKHRKCIFHGAAFLWKERAWIIVAPSGTGKTTQLLLWQKLFGKEIEVINGDKPVIECRKDESVWLYPSPWNGKENISGIKSGRLCGIIYLEQAEYNEISRMDIRSSILPVYRQFLYYGDYEEEIREAGVMLDVILRNIPVWKLKNLGNETSAKLTHDMLMNYLESEVV